MFINHGCVEVFHSRSSLFLLYLHSHLFLIDIAYFIANELTRACNCFLHLLISFRWGGVLLLSSFLPAGTTLKTLNVGPYIVHKTFLMKTPSADLSAAVIVSGLHYLYLDCGEIFIHRHEAQLTAAAAPCKLRDRKFQLCTLRSWSLKR